MILRMRQINVTTIALDTNHRGEVAHQTMILQYQEEIMLKPFLK